MYGSNNNDVELSADVGNRDLDTPDPALRDLYSADVSSSILQKFAAWYQDYNRNNIIGSDDSYFIVRSDNNRYIAYFGDIESDGSINSAVKVVYAGTTSGYNTNWTWTVYEDGQYNESSVDLDGYSAYIYSSYSTYPSNPYLADYYDDRVDSLLLCSILLLACVVSLGALIRGWFNARKEK